MPTSSAHGYSVSYQFILPHSKIWETKDTRQERKNSDMKDKRQN